MRKLEINCPTWIEELTTCVKWRRIACLISCITWLITRVISLQSLQESSLFRAYKSRHSSEHNLTYGKLLLWDTYAKQPHKILRASNLRAVDRAATVTSETLWCWLRNYFFYDSLVPNHSIFLDWFPWDKKIIDNRTEFHVEIADKESNDAPK